ncbi:hypothetical protein Daus18300_011619 [Diaporthe australafricana]|uniref:Uncharacterized protein n=1 Tax=Diaporthe australafricana TaxID=127596 RepID=A0ABR3W5S0_9PEZI
MAATADARSVSPNPPEWLANQAVISWLDVDGSMRYLYESDPDPSRQIMFDVFFDDACPAALFRARAPVSLKASPNEKTQLYLYLYADRVESLSCESSDGIPEEIQQKLGAGPTCLRFGLSKPADLVVPQTSLVPAKRKGHGDRLDALKLLAQATSWVVHLADGSMTDALVQRLCAVVAERRLKPLPVADPSGLYSGKGGRVLEGFELLPPRASPPSYNEIASPPPPEVSKQGAGTSGPLKRRRDHGDENIEATCTSIVERMMAKYRAEDRAFLRSEVSEIRSELMQMKKDMIAYVDERVSKLEDKVGPEHTYSKDEVDEEIERLRSYNDDITDVKLDDRMDDVKIELEEPLRQWMESSGDFNGYD